MVSSAFRFQLIFKGSIKERPNNLLEDPQEDIVSPDHPISLNFTLADADAVETGSVLFKLHI